MSTAAMTMKPFMLRATLALGLLPADNVSAQTESKTEVITYHDNTSKWVLGQTASLACAVSVPASTACDGDVVRSTTFDATYALPITISAFGLLQSTQGYDTTSTLASGQRGTLRTGTDGNNHTTTLTVWVRGIPTLIQYADGTSRSAVVDAATGWIGSVTDQNTYSTSYGYDAMGRLANITYPTGDTVVWANTTRSFVPVATAEYSIAAGHWRETVTTGNANKITYYDAMWRPLLVREYDASNMVATEQFSKTTYDAAGRVNFASYPSATSAPTTGVWTLYDDLGRVTSVNQDSELGLLSTTTAYGNPFTTTVTNPRGKATTTGYQTYDQPSTDSPISISLPEGALTTIVRDPFGKPTSISRSGN